MSQAEVSESLSDSLNIDANCHHSSIKESVASPLTIDNDRYDSREEAAIETEVKRRVEERLQQWKETDFNKDIELTAKTNECIFFFSTFLHHSYIHIHTHPRLS